MRMRSVRLQILTTFILFVCSFARAQVLCINENEHRPCTPSEAKQVQDKVCAEEPAPANLFVTQPVRFSGTFFDPSGAPLDFDSVKPEYHTIAQIRNLETGAILFAVPLNHKGQFDFEQIPAGTYRLILVWMKDGKFSRLPLTDQPKEIRCSGSTQCEIRAVVTIHGTDNPIDFCLPK